MSGYQRMRAKQRRDPRELTRIWLADVAAAFRLTFDR